MRTCFASEILRAEAPCVAITFDDGWSDLIWAFSELKARGLPATLFLTTVLPELRETGRWENFTRAKFPRLSETSFLVPLSWDELRELVKEGLEIGSHGYIHIRFASGAEEELRVSRKMIRERLSVETKIFAYPYGRRRDIELSAKGLLPASGYEMGFIGHGWAVPDDCDPLLIPRHPVKESWSPERFKGILAGKTDLKERMSWWVQGLISQR
ncbi:MAG: polysaccharide deacetylase family protein [candidate division WOR-3 bacterium]